MELHAHCSVRRPLRSPLPSTRLLGPDPRRLVEVCAAAGENSLRDRGLRDRIRSLASLRGVASATLDTLVGAADIVRLQKAQVFVPRIHGSDDVLFVLDGAISIDAAVADGTAVLLDMIEASGPLWIKQYMDAAGTNVEFRAEIPSAVARVPGPVMRALAGRDAAFALRLLEASAHGSRRLIGHMVNTRKRPAIARFAHYLHERIRDEADPEPSVMLSVSKHSIARLLDLSAPSLSRALRSLIEDGLVSGTGRYVRILDRSRLARLAT